MPSKRQLELIAQARLRQQDAPKEDVDWTAPSTWAKGLGENAMNIGTGMVSTPIAEAIATAYSTFHEDSDGKADEIASHSQDYTYQPKSAAGRAMHEAIGNAVKKVGIDRFFEWVAHPDAGSTEFGEHTIKTLLAVTPFLGQLRKALPAMKAAAVTTPEAVANAGIDISKPGAEISEQITGLAQSQRTAVRGGAMPAIKDGLEQAAEIHQGKTRALYAQADDLDGTLAAPKTRALKTSTESVVDHYNVYDSADNLITGMSAVDKRLADFRATFRKNAQIKISDIEGYRQRLLRDARRTTNEQEGSALHYMRKQLDDWEMNEFTNVVRAGSRETFEAYLKARDSSRSYVAKFTEDKVIDNLLNKQNVTVRELRDTVFGASKNGLPHGAKVVERLNSIFGPESRQMNALRQDFLYDVVDPLINEENITVGMRKFVDNYEAATTKQWELVDALAPFSKSGIDQAYHVSKAMLKLGISDSTLMSRIDPVKMVVRIVSGNKLAQGTAKMGLYEALVRTVINTVKPNRRRLWEQLFGYDPNAPFRKTNIAARGVVAAEEGQQPNDAQQ